MRLYIYTSAGKTSSVSYKERKFLIKKNEARKTRDNIYKVILDCSTGRTIKTDWKYWGLHVKIGYDINTGFEINNCCAVSPN